MAQVSGIFGHSVETRSRSCQLPGRPLKGSLVYRSDSVTVGDPYRLTDMGNFTQQSFRVHDRISGRDPLE